MNDNNDNCNALNVYILTNQVNCQKQIMVHNCFIISIKSEIIFHRKSAVA